ncbi:MAG: hypothetical protein WCI53_10185 [Bacteroidota bacterium]|jgi:hypothetical protein
MKKIITFIAISILLFGCTKEEPAEEKMNSMMYEVTSAFIGYDIVYLTTGGATLTIKGGGSFKYIGEFKGTKYLYLSVNFTKPDNNNTVTLKIYKNNVVVAQRTTTTSATLSGNY